MDGSTRRTTPVLLAVLAFGASACADAPRTVVTSKAPDTRQFVTTAFPLWVDVRGRPFGDAAAAELGATIVAAMRQAYVWNPAARFTTSADEARGRETRVVMTFNGAAGIGGRDQCQDRSQGGGPLPEGRITIVATLCSGEDALANVGGRVAAGSGPSDPRFEALIRQVTTDMFRTDPDARRPRIAIGGGGGGIGVGIGVGGGVGVGVGVGGGGGGVGVGVDF
ncbi:MAG: hypothetical protein ACFCUO_07070 [Rhodospirillales bacterium]